MNFGSDLEMDAIYRIISGPTHETAEDLFSLNNGSINDYLYHATASNVASYQLVNLGVCPTTTCAILDIEVAEYA